MQSRSHRPLAGFTAGRLAGALLLALAGGAAQAADCASLATATPFDSTVTSAAVVPAGAIVTGTTRAPVDFCRVQGTARPSSDSEIKWEVWLPLTPAAWTGRMKVNGTGGYAGATPTAR